MLVHRSRRWSNIIPTLAQRISFAGQLLEVSVCPNAGLMLTQHSRR